MTDKAQNISHAKNRTGVTTTNKVLTVAFPTSSITGLPVTQSVRNHTQRKLFSAALGFQRVQLLAFVLLGAALLAVVFILPNAITPPTPQIIVDAKKAQQVVVAPPDSPWSDAQLAKQRREAQEVLSKILDIQGKLESKKVQLWGQEALSQAMAVAANGDEFYRQRQFTQAQTSYRDSLSQFEALIGRVDGVFEQQMRQGHQAISKNQPQPAIDSFQLAMHLKPLNSAAQVGLARAKVLHQVIEHIKEGTHLLKLKKLIPAKQQFEQALALDSASKPAQQQLKITKQAIVDDNFGQAMSAGYAAINQQQYGQAIKSFEQAKKIKPQAKDAATALTQAHNKDVQSRIASHLAQAQQLEQQEQWHDAKAAYDKIQALDASVLTAKIGIIRTQARAKLDDQLQSTLNQPQRLTATSVFSQSQQLHQEARRIKQPGQRLNGQINQLAQLLNQVKQPVPVKIESNNQTIVTLFKVGELGSFNAKQMDLKPGKYTLMGTRNGYRDVRRDFTLTPGGSLTTIVVQCEDKITNG